VRFTLAVGALFLPTLVLLGMTVVGYVQAQNNAVEFKPRPLTGLSSTEIGQYAIDYTKARYDVVSGTPAARIVRPINREGLRSAGLGDFPALDCNPSPLMLVIVHGDFDLSRGAITSVDPSQWHSRVEYIGYVFDMQVGLPTLTTTSPKGGELGVALGNPNLPTAVPIRGLPRGAQPPPVPPAVASPVPTPAPVQASCPQIAPGSVVPGIVPPGSVPRKPPARP
jgi:hypothetical protein